MPNDQHGLRYSSAARVVVFLVLTFLLASGPYIMMARTGSTRDYVLLWMWSPGIAAIGTCLLFRQDLRSLGWKLPSPRFALVGLAIPLGYSLLIYGVVWATGLGGFQGQPAARIFLFITLGLVAACLAALGEEIGWRGFLVLELTRRLSFSKAAAFTGVVWAVWHYPAVLFADYHSQSPRWFDLLSLTVTVIGLSFFVSRLRLASGSIWPCVIWHGAHNLFIQQIFYDLTVPSTLTHYFIDDFGIGVLLASLVLGVSAWIVQNRSERLPVVSVSPAS
jgi:membrane protease YdiL (CAAX protease family)